MENINLITYQNLNEHSQRIAHFSSTRMGGISESVYKGLNLGLYTNDKPEHVQYNRSLLCQSLGISTAHLHNAHQTHGNSVKLIDEAFLQIPLSERQQALQGYDALITNIPQQCVTVTTADCVPVLLYDKENQAVAAVHSGWRSTLENICAETLSLMHKQFGTNAAQVVAAIGPCISQQNYEVGAELYTAFQDKGYDCNLFFKSISNGKYLFDVRELVKYQLLILGISNIETSTYCTFAESDLFFSARRLGNDSGRMLSGIYLR